MTHTRKSKFTIKLVQPGETITKLGRTQRATMADPEGGQGVA